MPTAASRAQPRRKTVYRVRNWPEYERALVARGGLNLWLSEAVLSGWRYQGPRARGAQPRYSDGAIQAALCLKAVLHLTNRATEGFLRALFAQLGLDLPVPDHTTLGRRAQRVPVALPRQAAGPLDVVLDSSGLKVYGEGEWKVRQHGASKRRTWRKLHLALDPASGEIQAAMLSDNGVTDAQMVGPLLDQLQRPLASTTADGSYDQRRVYTDLAQRAPQAAVCIPPRRSALIWQHGNSAAAPLPRDQNLRAIRARGRRAWKAEVGYHQRSLIETTMFRLKTSFGPSLHNRLLPAQATEVGIRCRVLNIWTHLGMPVSRAVT
jgi:DDE family transposase